MKRTIENCILTLVLAAMFPWICACSEKDDLFLLPAAALLVTADSHAPWAVRFPRVGATIEVNFKKFQ